MISLISFVLISVLAQIATTDESFTSELKLDKVKEKNEELLFLNEAFDDSEKEFRLKKNEVDLKRLIEPLPPMDVKCLISHDRHCSEHMIKIKVVMIQALKEDCLHCSEGSKLEAGRVITAMMAHHPAAWKTFRTRYDTLKRLAV